PCYRLHPSFPTRRSSDLTAHCFFNDIGRTPHTDILFYTEIGRQASLAVSHAFLDVSTDDVFIFEGSEAAVAPAAWTRSRPSVGEDRKSTRLNSSHDQISY